MGSYTAFLVALITKMCGIPLNDLHAGKRPANRIHRAGHIRRSRNVTRTRASSPAKIIGNVARAPHRTALAVRRRNGPISATGPMPGWPR